MIRATQYVKWDGGAKNGTATNEMLDLIYHDMYKAINDYQDDRTENDDIPESEKCDVDAAFINYCQLHEVYFKIKEQRATPFLGNCDDIDK